MWHGSPVGGIKRNQFDSDNLPISCAGTAESRRKKVGRSGRPSFSRGRHGPESARSAFLAAALLHPLPEAFAHLAARLLALGRGQRAVAIGVEPVEPGQRPLAHLLEGDEALLAEHALSALTTLAAGVGAAATGPAHAAHAAHAGTPPPPGPPLAALLAQLAARLVELNAADAAVAVEVEPLEHPPGALGAPLLARLAGLFGRGAAVTVDVEPREALVGAGDHLLTGDVDVAVGPRARRRLGQRG